MSRFTNEFKVGLLTMLAIAFVALFIARTDDRHVGVDAGYTLFTEVPSASGLQVSTQVVIAGVPVGSVRSIQLRQGVAKLELEMDGAVKLPVDSYAQLSMDGLLGDKSVKLTPGVAASILANGDIIETRPGDIDTEKLTEQVEKITEDVGAITAALRAILEDEGVKSSLDATVKNIEALSRDVRELSTANRDEIDAIAKNLREVSDTLNAVVSSTGDNVNAQIDLISDANRKLNQSLDDINEITAGVKAGEGTVGSLLTDDTPVRQVQDTLSNLNTTLDEVNSVVASVSQLRTEVYYDGWYLVGTEPETAAFAGDNPFHRTSRNALGMQIMPREDYWYVFEVVDHPLGSFDFEQVENPELGSTYTRYTRTRGLRFSFQFARRYDHLVFRLGVKDSSGGVGMDAYFLDDRLRFSADLYEFTYGSWPVLDGMPNLRAGVQIEPYPHVYLQGGIYNALGGLQHGYVTGYAGAGLHFNDDDFKWIIATLPSIP